MSRWLQVWVLAVIVSAAQAQTLTIPVGQQAPELQGIAVPQRGMSPAEVESQFGAPLVKGATVGQPPVSRWEYADYDVYFERDQVLHTVLRHKR